MARIQTSTPGRLLRSFAKRLYGYMPGITQVVLPDLPTAVGVGIIYNHLHLGKRLRSCPSSTFPDGSRQQPGCLLTRCQQPRDLRKPRRMAGAR
jgi:hypothetical protein